MAVKLSQKQLRSIVSEVMNRRPRRVKESYPDTDFVDEAEDHKKHAPKDTFSLASDFVDAVAKNWEEMYSDDDPSMSASGKDGWKAQCDAAAEELLEQVEELVEQLDGRLIDGQYSMGSEESPHTMRDTAPPTVRDVGPELPPLHPRAHH